MDEQRPACHPTPEIAAFVAALKAAFGERDFGESIRH
jgi:hypothetical protein